MGSSLPTPIDISSSDSDSDLREIDNYRGDSPVRDTATSVNPRVPQSLASTSQNRSNFPGYNGIARKDPSSSSNKQAVHEEFLRKHRNVTDTVGSSSSQMAHDTSYLFSSTGKFDPRREIYSSNNQPMKRALPISINNQPWPTSSNGRTVKENIMWGPSLVNGKYPPTIPYSGPSPIPMHGGLGEERPLGADERLVFQAAVQDLHQPKQEAKLPDGLLSVALLRHQKIALAWMLSKESSGLCLGGILADDQGLGKTVSTISLILMQKFIEDKSKPKDSITEALNLDDDNGNGVVALDDTNHFKESEDITILPEKSNKINGFRSKRPKAGTLIVCPASVLRQWARELDEKVTDDARLSVLIYHGGNRTKDPAELAKYDAVLTTYAIVTNEVPKQPLVDDDDDELKDGERYGVSSSFAMEKKRKKMSKKKSKGKNVIDTSAFDSNCGALAKVIWSRVVLDESQTIKNHRTQVARACCTIRAKRRWCLSGTPIQNSVDELYSYFRFLRYDPYDKFKTFTTSIKHMISRDSVNGYKKLQVILRNIMLRRTKGTFIDGKPIINLPPKTVHLSKVNFSIEERAFYNQLEADSRKQFKEYAAAGTVSQNYANILLLLLRLRQACDHPRLVKGLSSSDPVGNVSSQMAKKLPRELLTNLLKQLETSLAICLTCRDPPENGVVTMCGHVFCYQCVSDHVTGEDNMCPAPECKEQLGTDVVYSRSTLRKCISDDIDGNTPDSNEPGDRSIVLRSEFISSKIKSALEILRLHCLYKSRVSEFYDLDGDASYSGGVCVDSEVRGSEKAIVFSQWTSMLDLLEISLKNSGLNYRRLDGTMSIAARDKAVKDFNTDPKVDVMIMSLKAGNLGLNMVAASRVILLDLWWNPATEDQAVDRAHRIGQTRPVTVSRLTISDTVEDRILALQEDKRKMVASAFGEDQSGGHATRLTVEDLRFLFEGR